MNGMIKKAWIGLALGLGLLAGASAGAGTLTFNAPVSTAGTKALVFTPAQLIGTESAAQTITLTAAGPVIIEAIGVANSNFSMQGNTCSGTVADKTSCAFTVTFTPEAAGTRYGEVVIRSNATGSPHVVYLQGTASKASQTVSFGTAPAIIVGGAGTVTATATSGLPVSYSTTSPLSICTISEGSSTVNGTGVGNCTITATQAGNANYTAATATQSFNISDKNSQSITSFTVPTTISVGGTGTVSATATSSLPVSYSTTSAASICTINGSTVNGIGVGACIITAKQAGNATYSAATPVTQTITINTMTSQTISFGAAPAISVGGTGTVTATGGGSGNAVTFTSTTGSVCSVVGSTVTGIAAGDCIIAANQAGNATYNPASQVTQTITIAATSTASGLCGQYGITSNTVLPRIGNTSKTLSISATQGYSFSFTTGAAGEVGQTNTNYSSAIQYMTISKNQCDYDPALLASKCAKQGNTGPLLYYKVGGTSSFQCILEPNTTYYANVRGASRNTTTNVFTNTCSGSCTFMYF